MKRWMIVAFTVGFGSGIQAQERQPAPAQPPGRDRQMTFTVAPGMEQAYYYTTRRGKMGITVSVSPQRSDSIGALVEAVSPGTPAFKAGIRTGDIISRFNGNVLVATTRESGKSSPGIALVEIAAGLNAGDTARVEYRRGVARRNVVLVLEPTEDVFFPSLGAEPGMTTPLPREWRTPQPMRPDLFVEGHDSRGGMMLLRSSMIMDLEVAPMNRGLGQYFGVSEGVLVISVPQGSTLNLRNGDVVTAIDGRKVTNPNTFFRALASYEGGEEFKLDIVRMKRREVVVAKSPSR